jgi:hypothetical protein
MADRAEVPPAIVARLGAMCRALPEVVEEPAWIGTRWRIRTRTFANVVMVDAGWPPVYAREAGTDGPAVVLTFRSSGPELEALGHVGPPFFRPPWAPGAVGMVLDPDPDAGATDWDEIAELVTESYCLLAPRKLADSVRRPDAGA